MTTPAAAPASRPTVVWTEIPVTDLAAASRFYAEVFGYAMTLAKGEPNDRVDFGMEGIGGHLYPGASAQGNGPTVHLCVPDTVEAAAARCLVAGGTVLGPVIDIPPGRFQYATDPDGNSLGLFQPRAV